MHDISLARNFHDMGCGDVPIIYTGWTSALLDKALEYWTWVGEGDRSGTAQGARMTRSLCSAYPSREKSVMRLALTKSTNWSGLFSGTKMPSIALHLSFSCQLSSLLMEQSKGAAFYIDIQHLCRPESSSSIGRADVEQTNVQIQSAQFST
jgi:hypothetical protein